MEPQQILVYDKQHYFFRILKYELSNHFKFENLKNAKDIIDESAYEMIVFVMYAETDLSDFIRVCTKWDKQILVCTHNKIIFDKLQNIKNVVLFDALKTKNEMVKQLHSFFDDLIEENKFNIERKIG